MNERIRELWEEAAKEPYGGTWEEHTAFMGKFAELIIQECMDQCFTDTDAENIAKHFGVEE